MIANFRTRRRVLAPLTLILLIWALAACRQGDAAPEATPSLVPSSPDALSAVPTGSPTPVTAVTPTPDPYPAAYPAPPTAAAADPSPYPYPVASETPLAATATPGGEGEAIAYLPVIQSDPPPLTPTAVPSPTPTFTPTPIPTVDFAAARAELASQGRQLAPVKIGFHTAVGGNSDGLEQWMTRLDEAGVPFFLKSVDNAQPLYIAQEMMRRSGAPHTLIFRRATGRIYDVPNYDLPPVEAAQLHWQRHMEVWPPELDPELVWIETINEVDKNRSEWLAEFALETARLALRDGYKWAAFGWSSGEPEPEHWQSPAMLEFLRLAAANPDRLAIALHEYSYLVDEIDHQYPYKVGRFQTLFRICDQYGIPRPTVLITEWGWTYRDVPPPDEAMTDIAWASRLYAPYPQVKGAALWYLGGGFAGIADEAQRLIEPVMIYSLTNYFAAPRPPEQAPVE